MSKEKYDQYIAITNNDPNSASAGILLYLALVHRYNYSQNRIAFVSANIDGTGNKLAALKRIKEYLYKAQYVKISDSDTEDFSLCNENLYDLYKIYAKEQKNQVKEFPIPKTSGVDWNDTKTILLNIQQMETELISFFSDENKKRSQLKYSSVKDEFEKVGLIVPLAFEKPDEDTEDISWAFRYWKDNMLNMDYFKLRSSIIPVCMTIQKIIEEPSMSYNIVFRGKDRTTDVNNMLSDIIELFPENVWTENNNSLYIRIVRECVSLCDAVNPKKYSKGEKVAAEAVLKITRNWMSHQGIKNIEAFDVAFMIHALIVVFFECSNLSEQYNYKGVAEELVLTFEDSKVQEISEYEYKNIINKMECIAKKRHKDSYYRFLANVGETYAKKVEGKYTFREDASIYNTISAIGNQYSDLRENVKMEYVYLLYLSMIDINDDNVIANSLIKRLVQSKEFDE